MTRAFVLAILCACGGAAVAPEPWHYDDKPALAAWPAIQTAFVARAAEDLGCDPSAVAVIAFTRPHTNGTGAANTSELDRTGLAIAEGAGARVTYAVLPEIAAAYTSQPIPQNAFVLIARTPVVANAPASTLDDGSGSTP